VCVSFNTEWASLFSGAIGALLDRRYWQGDDDEYRRISQAIEKVLSKWSGRAMAQALIPGDVTTQYDDVILGYDGTPESVHYEAPDTFFDMDSGDDPIEALCRKNALCRAAELWVRLACNLEMNRRQSAGDWVSYSLGIPVALAGVKVPAPWLYRRPYWKVVWDGAFGVFDSLSDAVLSDVCAQFRVACPVKKFGREGRPISKLLRR
jgi:hypothetical protein